MTTTVIDNNHADKDDKDRIDMTSNDSPSEHLSTKNPKNGPEFHKNPIFVVFGDFQWAPKK